MRLTRLLTEKEIELVNDYSLKEEKKLKLGDFTSKNNVSPQELENKLGQLEDIEEEIGVEFSMLDKICNNGVYCYKRSIKYFNENGKRLGEIIHIQNDDIHIQFFGVCQEKRMGVSIMGCIDYVYHTLPLKDYGKTWALTMEELTDEKI